MPKHSAFEILQIVSGCCLQATQYYLTKLKWEVFGVMEKVWIYLKDKGKPPTLSREATCVSN